MSVLKKCSKQYPWISQTYWMWQPSCWKHMFQMHKWHISVARKFSSMLFILKDVWSNDGGRCCKDHTPLLPWQNDLQTHEFQKDFLDTNNKQLANSHTPRDQNGLQHYLLCLDLCCITTKTQEKQHASALAIVSFPTHDPAIHKLQQSLLTMRTDGHARLKSIKVMVIQNVSGLCHMSSNN